MTARKQDDPIGRTANVVWQNDLLGKTGRELRHGHQGAVIWLTGLPGSGKSTIAHAVERHLYQEGYQTIVLDGDNIRHGLCSDLGFSLEDRRENIRRVGELAKLLVQQGMLVIVALVSPLASSREQVRHLFEANEFNEIYCLCDVKVCKQRDPKGLYLKAEQGLIPMFSGVSAEYEIPSSPEVVLLTGVETAEACIEQLVRFVRSKHPIVINKGGGTMRDTA